MKRARIYPIAGYERAFPLRVRTRPRLLPLVRRPRGYALLHHGRLLSQYVSIAWGEVARGYMNVRPHPFGDAVNVWMPR